jgi:hypothetical protein
MRKANASTDQGRRTWSETDQQQEGKRSAQETKSKGCESYIQVEDNPPHERVSGDKGTPDGSFDDCGLQA